jgi:hypothetical protein
MAQIDTLKTLLQIDTTAQDELLDAIIAQCADEYLLRTHQTEADDSIVISMSLERYNKLSNEGLSAMNYSGIQETYFSDYSAQTLALIKSKTRMVAI